MMKEKHECKQSEVIDTLFTKYRGLEVKVYVMYAVALALSGFVSYVGQNFYENLRVDMKEFRSDVIEVKINSAKTSTILERLEKKLDKEMK